MSGIFRTLVYFIYGWCLGALLKRLFPDALHKWSGALRSYHWVLDLFGALIFGALGGFFFYLDQPTFALLFVLIAIYELTIIVAYGDNSVE
ncbi:MAG: hypothetical protein HQ519_10740 [Planctomycetes bacterium]|nr:hypothetical protein [Planctomycetota bacterium]